MSGNRPANPASILPGLLDLLTERPDVAGVSISAQLAAGVTG